MALAEMQPDLWGLVLAGGESKRMGTDKSSLIYHQTLPQRLYLYHLLKSFCAEVFISCREEQAMKWTEQLPYLPDTTPNIGPMAGVLSAFEFNSKVAWLLVACDMPMIDDLVIKNLIQHRNSSKIATFYHHSEGHNPEPMLSIWEPMAFAVLLEEKKQGQFSLKKILQKENTGQVENSSFFFLKNVNTPKEYLEMKKQLEEKNKK